MTRLDTGFFLIIVAAITLFSGCAAVPTEVDRMRDASLEPLAFLEGAWATPRDGANNWVEEHWTSPIGGAMVGMSRTVSFPPGDVPRTSEFEFQRIERRSDGDTYYMASPQGRSPATAFKLVKSATNEAIFENKEHDFPSRIIYKLDEDGTLIARIEGTRNGHPDAMAWRLARLPE